jgi:competence protein ComEA
MTQSLLHDAASSGNSHGRRSVGASAASAGATVETVALPKPRSVWRPVFVRVILGGFAILGLAGVGGASMLAGLDGARANPPAPLAASTAQTVASGAHAGQNGGVLAQPSANATAAIADAGAPEPAQAGQLCSTGLTPEGKVVLNLATVATLRKLPRIGQKRADSILALRDKLKRFHRAQELLRVRGIGAKTLRKMLPLILIDPPPGSGCDSANQAKHG